MSASLNEQENLLLGTGVALFEGLLLQPTIYWKNARQQHLPWTLNPRLLYRGTGANLTNEAAQMALHFGVVGKLKGLLGGDAGELCAAGVGGAIVALAISPIELVMIQQQRFGGTILGTPLRVIRERGLMGGGIMRGVGCCAMRDALSVGGMLGVAPVVQRWFAARDGDARDAGGGGAGGGGSMGATLVGTLAGGAVGALISHPFDVIKTCMQGDLERKTYGGTLASARLLLRCGIGRLYEGVMWRGLHLLVAVYICTEACDRMPRHVRRLTRGADEDPALGDACSVSASS